MTPLGNIVKGCYFISFAGSSEDAIDDEPQGELRVMVARAADHEGSWSRELNQVSEWWPGVEGTPSSQRAMVVTPRVNPLT